MQETIRIYRELWGWKINNPRVSTAHWPGWKANKLKPTSITSLLCTYAQMENGRMDCNLCPIDWNALTDGWSNSCRHLQDRWYAFERELYKLEVECKYCTNVCQMNEDRESAIMALETKLIQIFRKYRDAPLKKSISTDL